MTKLIMVECKLTLNTHSHSDAEKKNRLEEVDLVRLWVYSFPFAIHTFMWSAWLKYISSCCLLCRMVFQTECIFQMRGIFNCAPTQKNEHPIFLLIITVKRFVRHTITFFLERKVTGKKLSLIVFKLSIKRWEWKMIFNNIFFSLKKMHGNKYSRCSLLYLPLTFNLADMRPSAERDKKAIQNVHKGQQTLLCNEQWEFSYYYHLAEFFFLGGKIAIINLSTEILFDTNLSIVRLVTTRISLLSNRVEHWKWI